MTGAASAGRGGNSNILSRRCAAASTSARAASGAGSAGGAAAGFTSADTIRSFKAIVNGECDQYPEQAFYMVGAIEEVAAKAQKMAADTK